MDEARYAGTDTPLPPMSQIYEIERDLPPVYAEDAEPRRVLKSPSRIRRLEELLADQPSQYLRPIQPATTPKRSPKEATKAIHRGHGRHPRLGIDRGLFLVAIRAHHSVS